MKGFGGIGAADKKKLTSTMLATLGICTLLFVGYVAYTYVGSKQNPEVILAQATLAEKNAVLWEAKGNALPQILLSVAYMLVGVGVAALAISIGASMVASFLTWNATRLANNGFAFVKRGKDGETQYYIANPESLVAQHIGSGTSNSRIGPSTESASSHRDGGSRGESSQGGFRSIRADAADAGGDSKFTGGTLGGRR